MKVIKIVIVMLVLIMSVGAVCAADTISDDCWGDDNQTALQTVQEDISTADDSKSTFNDLQNNITNSENVLNLNNDYKFDNGTDNSTGVRIQKNDYVIEGNGRTIDANYQSRIFIVTGNNITINNLKLINAFSNAGCAIYINEGSSLILNNVTFEKNFASVEATILVNTNSSLTINGGIFNDNFAAEATGMVAFPNSFIMTNNVTFVNNTSPGFGIITLMGGSYVSNHDRFIDSASATAGVIYVSGSEVVSINNALMMSSNDLAWGFIFDAGETYITVTNSTFANTTSKYSTAIRGSRVSVKNSRFINLHADFTAGAIAIKGNEGYGAGNDGCEINNCTFINVTSEKNGGAIFGDYVHSYAFNILIANSSFADCHSKFGGVLLQLGGNLTVDNCNFTNNSALFGGGAIYTSYVQAIISDSVFDGNLVIPDDGSQVSCGGAIFCDMGTLNLSYCELSSNIAQSGGAIYIYDSNYTLVKNIFENNLKLNKTPDDIFSAFDGPVTILENNTSGNGTFSLNKAIYETVNKGAGMKLVLTNNTIDVASLPSKFDLRDWGWVTSVKDQGSMGACWTFGSSAAIESAILKYLGIDMDLSENNMQDLMVQFSMYGRDGLLEGAVVTDGAAYALSWMGVFSTEDDTYDQLGKISPVIKANDTIHIQDVVLVDYRNNITDNYALKKALITYGALCVDYLGVNSAPYCDIVKGAQYCNESFIGNHAVTLIGWDDSYSASNFIITPPGDGAWIIKNSWGTNKGDEGYFYISYYDQTFAVFPFPSGAYLFNNTVEYNKNYQYDISGGLNFYPSSGYVNIFEAVDDDLIAGIGTYFNESGVEYSVEVYVNGTLKLVQNGLSPFYGFHTIQLDSFIPIKKGDVFAVLIKSNAVPLLENSRQHYIEGTSQYVVNGTTIKASDNGSVCSIKVYTVCDDTKVINNKDISVDYAGGSYFSVKVVTSDGHAVGAGEKVTFTINKNPTTVTTDKDGIAKIKIKEGPGKYALTTKYNGKTYANKVTVKHVLTATKVTVKKTAKKFTLKATLKINGKAVNGKWVTFKFNGKTYKVKTTSKGVAQKTLKKNVIKKLKKGKTYSVKVTYSKDTIKTTVKVR